MEHGPAVIHVIEVTQPQGHPTSASHERYKTKERLEWEVKFDGVRKMRDWMIAQGIATAAELDAFEKEDLQLVPEAQRRAWAAYRAPIDADVQTVLGFLHPPAHVAAAALATQPPARGPAPLRPYTQPRPHRW